MYWVLSSQLSQVFRGDYVLGVIQSVITSISGRLCTGCYLVSYHKYFGEAMYWVLSSQLSQVFRGDYVLGVI